MEEIIGDASKSRLIAAFIDHLIAVSLMFFVVAQVPEEYPLAKMFLFFGVYMAYYALFEGLWSRTPGKFFQGLVVRKLDGSPCGLTGGLIRSLTRIVEVNPILLGGLPAGLVIISTQRKQRIGDLLAGTVVVSTKAAYTTTEEVSETSEAVLRTEE